MRSLRQLLCACSLILGALLPLSTLAGTLPKAEIPVLLDHCGLKPGMAFLRIEAVLPVPDPAKGLYDMILLDGIYPRLADPRSYLTGLLPALKQGGRIVIIQPTDEEYFLPSFISDADLLSVHELFKGPKGEDHPVFKRLRAITQACVRQGEAKECRIFLAEDLNAMLAEPGFFGALRAFYYVPREENPVFVIAKMGTGQDELVKLLLGQLEDTGALDKEPGVLSREEKDMVNRLNGVCIRAILGLKKPFAELRERYLAGRQSIIRAATGAGYKVSDGGAEQPGHIILEFVKP
ncbi:MAG: hypothetical protein WCO69_01645 [Candidatus Omnitrophota bacterium]